MKEMILLFNPPAKEQLLKIRSALLPLHIRIQLIKPEQYNQPLGYLAGMKDISPVEGNYAGEELPDTMFLFSSLSAAVSIRFWQPFAKAEPARSRIKPS